MYKSRLSRSKLGWRPTTVDDVCNGGSLPDRVLSQYGVSNTPAVVKVKHGMVEGGVSDDGSYRYWFGVPYAAPPVDTGNHKGRWRAPQDPEKWTGMLPARQFKNHCIQVNILRELNMDIDGSEDCLYINIWRPNTDEKSLPVFFWIHGGGFQLEAALMGAYNGANFATSQNAIVVTFDYRLGYLGWLRHQALHQDNATDADRSGNFALLDVIKALSWVQENIEAFGGDKDKVTVAGQSAGGAFTLSLMVSPMVKAGYFRSAIIQSAPIAFGNSVSFRTLDDAEAAANTLITNILVRNGDADDTLQAEDILATMTDEEIEMLLRSADAKTLVELAWERAAGTPMFPDTVFMDGHVLSDTADTDFANGNYLHVPILTGITAHEGRSFPLLMVASGRPEALSYIKEEFDPNARDNLTAAQFLTVQEQALYALITPLASLMSQISETSLLGQISSRHGADIFVYQFEYNDAPAPMDALFASGHMSELPFVFGNIRADSVEENCYAYFLDADATLDERTRLSERMMNYWGAFVRIGNPNDPTYHDQPSWNNYSSNRLLKRLHIGKRIYMAL